VTGVPAKTTWIYDNATAYTLGSKPTLTGWTFGGWFKESSCTNKVGDAGASLTKPNLSATNNATVNLYAKWTANTYSVVYNANKPANATGTVTEFSANATWTYDSNATLEAELTLNGWIFEGWYKQNGTKVGNSGVQLTKPNLSTGSSVTLYAHWVVDPYTIGQNVANKALVSDTSLANSYYVYNVIGSEINMTLGNCQNAHKVIIDWTNSTTTEYGHDITISKDISEVFIIGNKNKTYNNVKIYTIGYDKDDTCLLHIKDLNLRNSRIDNSICFSKHLKSSHSDFSILWSMYLYWEIAFNRMYLLFAESQSLVFPMLYGYLEPIRKRTPLSVTSAPGIFVIFFLIVFSLIDGYLFLKSSKEIYFSTRDSIVILPTKHAVPLFPLQSAHSGGQARQEFRLWGDIFWQRIRSFYTY